MTPTFDITRTYRIINKVSGSGLLAGSWGTDAGDHHVWQYPLDEIGSDANGFAWALFPDDAGFYFIVNLVSGMLVLPEDWGTTSARNVRQYSIEDATSRDRLEAFRWQIIDAGDGHCFIVNKVNGCYLLAGSYGGDAGDRKVLQQSIVGATEEQRKGFMWRVEEYGSLGVPALNPGTDTPPRINPLTGFQVPDEDSEKVLTGEAYLTFMMVTDPAYTSREKQFRGSPLYVLRRERRYTFEGYYEYSGLTEETRTVKVSEGWSTEEESSFERTLGIAITAEAEFEYLGVTGSMSTTISTELKVASSSSSSRMSTTETTVERTCAAGQRCAIASWTMTDLYTVLRSDGAIVSSWKLENPNIHVEDGWPKDANGQRLVEVVSTPRRTA